MKPNTVFLDRDGTINVKAPEGDYVVTLGAVELIPGAAQAIRMLNTANVRVVVVTNQRCIALGLATLASVEAVNERLCALLAAREARIDSIYLCPHDNGECDCRKPAPGLMLRAARGDASICLADSVIGDSENDVDAALAAGMHPVRLAVGEVVTRAQSVAPDLLEAVRALDL